MVTVKEGREDATKKMLYKHTSAGKEKKGWSMEEMARQHPGWHEIILDDEIHGAESKCVAHEDKGRPIATWRRPMGENTREVGILYSLTSCESMP